MIEKINTVTAKEEMGKAIESMNACGVRLTGSAAHNRFIGELKREIHEMGLETYTDPYFFNRWEMREASLALHTEEGDAALPISSVFPYSGETPEEGLRAPLIHVNEKHVGFLGAKDKIAVVNIDELDFLPSTLAFHIRNKQPETASIPEEYNGPVATAFVNFPFLQTAKLAGCRAVICIWRKMSDAMVEGQYLPFILKYQGIPAVWVNSSTGDKLMAAEKQGAEVTLKLTANKEENARTESFYVILPGKNRSEAILVNSHTDGTNCIEENGPIAMLSLLKYYKDKPLDRTLIFLFATGHFRLPSFKSQAGGGVQATSKWLAAHPDLWDGKRGHLKAVACVSIEHLGCKRFKDVDGEYRQVGDIETELVYTGNNTLDTVYYAALTKREKVNTITLRGHNFLHFGEGQPPFNCGIPEISLVTAPDCLTVISPNHEMDKFDIDLMYEQTETFLDVIDTLLPMPTSTIGKCDVYSVVLPNGKPILYSRLKKLVRKTTEKTTE